MFPRHFMKKFESDPFFREDGITHPFCQFPGGLQDMHHRRALQGHQPQNQIAIQNGFMSPFSMWPFGGRDPFSSMMEDMEKMKNNPNAHVYSSSSVMSYSSGGAGQQPKMYRANSTTVQGPGGVKESRQSVQDSQSGVKKMAIGHHIGDRSHTIEQLENVKTGHREERQNFVNLDDMESSAFDKEWTQKTQSLNRGLGRVRNTQLGPSDIDRKALPPTPRETVPHTRKHPPHAHPDSSIQHRGKRKHKSERVQSPVEEDRHRRKDRVEPSEMGTDSNWQPSKKGKTKRRPL